MITGASGGVGRATAHAFAKRSAHIGLLARGEKGLHDCRREVEALGGRALVIPTDVADPEQVEAAADRAEAELGPIDVWVNDAMATVFAAFADVTPAEYKRATEVTYLGAVYGTMAALRRMRARNRGRSCRSAQRCPTVRSRCSRPTVEPSSPSAASPTRSGPSCATNAVPFTSPWFSLPGSTPPSSTGVGPSCPITPQPVPPIYQPEIPAEAIYWAAHHRRRELWVGYSTLQAIIGTKLSALAGDIYLARTGFSGQQMQDRPVPPDRPDNLFEPLPEKAATHGIFDDQAKTRSPQLWLSIHRRAVAGASVAAAAAISAAVGAMRQ